MKEYICKKKLQKNKKKYYDLWINYKETLSHVHYRDIM